MHLSLVLIAALVAPVHGVTTRDHDSRTEACLRLLTEISPGWRPREGAGPPERWFFDGHQGATYYDKDFAELYRRVGVRSLSDVLMQRKMAGLDSHALDIFGSGFFIGDRTLVESITGLRLGAFSRETADPDFGDLLDHLPPTPTEILGDAMNPKTWSALRESMRSRAIPAMSLIVMRPEGGWQDQPFTATAEHNALALTFIIENALRVLSADGYFFFTVHIPQLRGDITTRAKFRELVADVERHSRFHLTLVPSISTIGTTHQLSGVLSPK